MLTVVRKLVWAMALYASVSAVAQDDPWMVLQKTANAARELNYQGIFVYQNGKHLRSVQITHVSVGGKEMTRNVVLDNNVQSGEPREVYSQGENIVIFHPLQQKVLVERRRGQNLFPAMLPTDLSPLKASYTAVQSSTDNVAGRASYITELVPNDTFRYRYKVWTDSETGLLLKMSLSSAENVQLEQIAFSQINMLSAPNTEQMQPRIDMSKQYVMQQEQPVQHVSNQWVVAHLPPGYRQIDHVERMVPGKTVPVNQIIFSDGIASVSLFIEPIGKGVRPKMGQTLMGSTNMCAHIVDGHQVIVVGEVPAATVRQISRSVSFRKSPEK
jgi:sigma-E factor negative regulatory protein RseB